GRAERAEVVQEGRPEQERDDAHDGVAARTRRADDVDRRCGRQRTVRVVVARQVDEHEGAREHDASLEAASGSEVPVRDDVRAAVMAEVRQARDRPEAQRRQPGCGYEEQPTADAAAHLPRSSTTATTITSGKPTAPTTSSESATSGAWKTRKRTTSRSA